MIPITFFDSLLEWPPCSDSIPHGNSKQLSCNRTCTSVLVEEHKLNEYPGNVDMGMVQLHISQCWYQEIWGRLEILKLSRGNYTDWHMMHCSIYMKWHYTLRKIIIAPGLVVVCGLKELFQNLHKLIPLSHCPKLRYNLPTRWLLSSLIFVLACIVSG